MAPPPVRGSCPRHGTVADAYRDKLNLGSGRDIRTGEGWVNSDILPAPPGATNYVQHDLLSFPWPFPDRRFDYVLACHVFEHIPYGWVTSNGVSKERLVAILDEIGRILRPGGVLDIFVPDGSKRRFWMHPEHCRVLIPETLEALAGFTAEFEATRASRFELVAVHHSRHGFYVSKGFNAWHLQKYLGLRSFDHTAEIHAMLRVPGAATPSNP